MRLKHILLAFAAGLLLAGVSPDQAMSSERYEIDPQVIADCIREGRSNTPRSFGFDRTLCIGRAAQACINVDGEDQDDDRRRVRTTGCALAEGDYWQTQVSNAYSLLKIWAKTPSKKGTEKARKLENMRLVWIDYISAKCIFGASEHSDYIEMKASLAGCQMYELGAQAVDLDNRINVLCNGPTKGKLNQACKRYKEAGSCPQLPVVNSNCRRRSR